MSTILIVEDNPLINRLFTKQFNAVKADTHSAYSIQQATEFLKGGLIPDIIILDLELGDGHGTRILEYLDEYNLKDAQVIVVSAHAYANDYNHIQHDQVVDVLVKPVSPRGLTALVKQLYQPA